MYNEVFKRCPECGSRGYMQIHQIVLGFGNFNLDDLSTLFELTSDELVELSEAVGENVFMCGGHPDDDGYGCGHRFRMPAVETAREQMIRKMFDREVVDD